MEAEFMVSEESCARFQRVSGATGSNWKTDRMAENKYDKDHHKHSKCKWK